MFFAADGHALTDGSRHYLLAASGVNPGNTRRDLHELASQTSSAPYAQAEPQWDPDSHKYVEQLQQQTTIKMIAESMKRANRNFDAYLDENVDIDWDAQRKKIYEHFGLAPRGAGSSESTNMGGSGSFGRSSRRRPGQGPDKQGAGAFTRSVFGKSSVQKSVIGTPGVGTGNVMVFGDNAEKANPPPTTQDDRFVRDKEMKFAEKVRRLNESRLQETVYPVLEEFASVESQSVDVSLISVRSPD